MKQKSNQTGNQTNNLKKDLKKELKKELSNKLSNEEKEVLRLVIKGYSNNKILKELTLHDTNYGDYTKDKIKLIISSIIDKLKVKNRIQASIIAIKEGIV